MPEHKVRLEEMLPLIRERLAAGQDVRFTPRGISMQPMLRNGRDTVVLSPVTGPLKKYDLPLYRRADGQFVLHRIVACGDNEYTCIGDNQFVLEPGVRQDQVLAVVNTVCRKGKILRRGNFWWDFFAQIWIRMISLRPAAMAVYSRLMK